MVFFFPETSAAVAFSQADEQLAALQQCAARATEAIWVYVGPRKAKAAVKATRDVTIGQ